MQHLFLDTWESIKPSTALSLNISRLDCDLTFPNGSKNVPIVYSLIVGVDVEKILFSWPVNSPFANLHDDLWIVCHYPDAKGYTALINAMCDMN